jgi:Tol biopolymer transport system component
MPSLSDDGRTLAYNRLDGIGIRDLVSGKASLLATGPGVAEYPVLSHDGRRVLFNRGQWNEQRALFIIPATGGPPERVCEDCGPASDWSRDGRTVLFRSPDLEPAHTISHLDLASGRKTLLFRSEHASFYRAHFSPDERWLVVHSDRPGAETPDFVVPYRGAQPVPESEWIPINDGKGFHDEPRWAPDGNAVYYVSDRDGFQCIWAQRLDPSTKHPIGSPYAVHHFHSRRHSMKDLAPVLPDIGVAPGRLVFEMADLRANIWMAELK